MTLPALVNRTVHRLRRAVGTDRRTATLLSVVLVGAALRFYHIGSESLWLDEALAYSHATDRSLWELVVWLPQRDPNPPLYYILLKGWTALVGTSPAAMRSLSALLGVLSILLVYLLGRRLFDDRVGMLAAVVLALSPYHVRYGQEARMYTLMIVAALASYLFLIRLRDDGGRWNAVGYVAATTVLVYSHTYGLFTVAAQVGYLASAFALSGSAVDWRSVVRRWLPAGAAVAALTAPWIALLALRVFGPTGQTGGVESGNAASAVTAPLPGIESLGSTYVAYWMPISTLTSGIDLTMALALVGVFISGATMILAVVTRSQISTQEGRLPAMRSPGAIVRSSRVRLLGLWAFVPVALPFALSYLVTPIFLHRYTISASVACYLLAVAGLARLRPRHLRYGVVALLVVGLVATLPTYYATDQKEQWEEATAYIEGNADPGDLVVISTDSAALSYNYHAERSDLDVEPVPEDATRADIANRTSGEGTVWFVVSHLADRHEERFQSVLGAEYEHVRTVEFKAITVYRYESDPAGSQE